MNYGVGKCVWSALGDVTANLIQATLVIFVIGSFFSENSLILNIFKWIGVLYILYLAYDIYKSRPKNLKDKEEVTKRGVMKLREMDEKNMHNLFLKNMAGLIEEIKNPSPCTNP